MSTIGILGAGLSGVLMGIRLRQAGVDDFVIYESQNDVGGTWLLNTYPGLHCDIPSHLYCYSFEPNPDFSNVYASQNEIQSYIRTCAEKYRLVERIRFNTTVERACFREEEGCWDLELSSGDCPRHRVLVAATGGLTAPHFPRIPNIGAFERPMWHSGAWRHDVELTRKTVAVIGSAASAVQVVPEVAKRAERVIIFSRTANWVTPRRNATYSLEEKTAFRQTDNWRATRRHQYRNSMLWHHAFLKHRSAIERLRATVLKQINEHIRDRDMVDALTPHYEPGCKRILVSDDYYPALGLPHVKLIPHGVVQMTPNSLIAADKSKHEVDIAVFCTGYKLGGREDGSPALHVRGRGGKTLAEVFSERPEAYRGIAVPGFPNYFTVCGINGAAAHAPLFLSAEISTGFITRWITKIRDRDIKLIEPKLEATRAYNVAIQTELQAMSWAEDCPGWYRDKEGRILPFHPGSIGRMRREMREDHECDFEIQSNAPSIPV